MKQTDKNMLFEPEGISPVQMDLQIGFQIYLFLNKINNIE